jgi:lysophospholipase L1-like esterase
METEPREPAAHGARKVTDKTGGVRGPDSIRDPGSADRSGRKKGPLFRLFVALASPIVFLALLDFALALGGFEYPPADSPIGFVDRDLRFEGKNFHESAEGQLWRPRPGDKIPWGENEHVNAQSFRGPELPLEKTPGVLRIATLGDSSTFGQYVPWEETYSARTAAKLSGSGVPAEVIDAGVIGFTIRQAIERYRLQVRAYKPDIVVGAFGSILEHLGSIGASDDQVILHQQMEKNPWVLEARRLRRDLRVLHLIAWCVDELHGGRDQGRQDRRARELWQVEIRPQLGRADWQGERRVSLAEFEKFILVLKREVEADGGKLVLLSLPRRDRLEWETPVLLEYTKLIKTVGEREGILVVDGHKAMVRARKDGYTIPEFMQDNVHPSTFGHEYLARELSEKLLESMRGGTH